MARNTVAARFNWFIILAVVSTVAVISSCVSAYLIHSYHKDLTEKDRLHLKGLASSVQAFMEQAYSLNHQLSRHPTVLGFVRSASPDWDQRLADYRKHYNLSGGLSAASGPPPLPSDQKHYSFVELFFVQDSKGDQVARSYGTIGHRGERWWFKKFMADPEHRPFVSKSYYSMTGDKPVSSVFHPMWDGKELIGVMGLDINFETLQSLANNYVGTRDLKAIVLDSEGVVIAHPDKSRMRELYDLKKLTRQVLVTDATGKTVQTADGHHQTRQEQLDLPDTVSALVKNALAGESGHAEDIRFDGRTSTIYFEPVPLPGGSGRRHYVVLMVRSSDTIVATKLHIALFSAMIALFISTLLIFVFRNLFRSVVLRPVAVLTDSMKANDPVGADPIRLATGDEFEDLANTYNAMQAALAHHRQVQDEAEARLRDIIDASTDWIWEIDAQSLFTYVSPRAEEMTGFTRAEMLGSRCFDFVAEEDRDNAIETLRGTQESGGGFSDLTVMHRHASGPAFPVEIAGIPFFTKDRTFCGIRGVCRDISQRVEAASEKERLERQLARSRRMEALGLLAGGVAHDLNNILAGIVGYPELILLESDLSADSRDAVKAIENCGRRAAATVGDLLTIARGAAVQKQIVSVSTIVEEYLQSNELANLQKQHPGALLRLEVAPDLKPVLGSAVHINQSIMNLVVNAVEALEDGGHITIRIEGRTLDQPLKGYDPVEKGDYVVLSVADDGPGIPEDDIEHIFEPFYSRKVMGRSGTGLGLAIVWNTMQDHKGHVNVESSSAGTTFELWFPASSETCQPASPRAEHQAPPGQEQTVLVVDDEGGQRDLNCRFLKHLGYTPEAVASGEEAVLYLREHRADLVILDMVMEPGIDGCETYRQILQDNPSQKAIVATGYADPTKTAGIRELGVSIILNKPFTMEQLGEALQKTLRQDAH